MTEAEQLNKLRQELAVKINKVPYRIQNGSIDATRAWMANRKQALKTLNKKSATTAELASALSSIE